MKHQILVVDDEKDIVDALERQLRDHYTVFKAESGIEALRILNKNQVQLIISDQRMPEMTGVQFFERAQKLQPDAIRILLTGYTDVESVIAAINTGQIYRYVTKPWDPNDLNVIVKRALEAYDLRKDLEVALKELQTLDQAKSHFMILIGHELKTPLTSLISYTDLLREQKLETDTKKFVERISQSTQRLQTIVLDVLDIMAAETGQIKLNKSSFKFGDLIDSALALIKATFVQKKLKAKVTGQSIKANLDHGVILKVLNKLIHNAAKFAHENSEIEIEIAEKSSKTISVRIKNQGDEIAQDKLNLILKPFTLDENIMHHTQGAGLGLAVCQSLLKAHGSSLILNSASGFTTVGFDIRTP